jgi:anthranilate synthase component 1
MAFVQPIVQTRQCVEPLDLLALHRAFPQRYPALLSSASGLVNDHRYDFLFADCVEVGLAELEQLDVASPQSHELPFIGGYVVFFPYEYAQEIEPTLTLPQAQAWRARVWRVSAAFIWDRIESVCHLVAQPDFASRLPEYWQDFDQVMTTAATESLMLEAQVHEPDGNRFIDGVEQCKHYILSGDVFQVNLSRQWQASVPLDVTPAMIYQQLRAANPAPFSALLTWDNQAIISSSPERLVSVRNGVVETRPIAGTRRRGADEQADEDLKSELSLHPKEQAEHVMLLDLERNDLGRVCQPGSVQVNELMTIETYTHVHHIVSNVIGQLRPNTSAKQVIDAVFPGGTITGCPKVRCMEIIAELEQQPRGVYTGSLGYISLDGQMDTNILIRSFHWQPGRLTFNAGAGIVYDSQAAFELEETRHKAKGLLRALAPEASS